MLNKRGGKLSRKACIVFVIGVAGLALSQAAWAEPIIATSPHESLLSPAIPSPPPPPGAWTPPSIAVAPCAIPPKIDGRIDDECWRTATHAFGFNRYASTEPVVEQTEAWICADKTHLYFAFHCIDSQPDKIRAAETQRDGGAYKDDYVGMQIDSQKNRRGLSRFLVTPRGTQWAALEGGTADNITWAGDWTGAAQRTSTGWTAEIAIPFALLHYPRGTKSFNMLIYRKMYRETSFTSWPYLPPTVNDAVIGQYMPSFTGITPPFYAPRPIILSYLLATAGAHGATSEGLDIKYPLTTTLTGLATIKPDFQTIEQNVTDVNFSYTEKFVNDRRPFFAEGINFLPGSELFYSPRIGQIDGGLKVAGKTGDDTLGLLTTTKQGNNGQNATAFNYTKDIGLYSQTGLSFVGDNEHSLQSNRVAQLNETYGWLRGRDRYTVEASHIQSWQGGAAEGGHEYVAFGTNPRPGTPGIYVDYNDIGPNFTSDLGYVPETNLRGEYLRLDQQNTFDRGSIESYYASVKVKSYQFHTGGFYRKEFDLFASANNRSGTGWNLSSSHAQRQPDTGSRFDDQVEGFGYSWKNKSLFEGGSMGAYFGRVSEQNYRFVSAQQGILITRPFSLQLGWNSLVLGDFHSQQMVLTGTYRLNSAQTLGGRLVQQDGSTNLFFSFGQKARVGDDLYILIGDPNSQKTKGQVTVKWVRPY